jgi:hypothetical protein
MAEGKGKNRVARREPSQGLASHLLPFYWRGLIPLDSEDSLIRHFFERASDDARSDAIDFAGRALHETEGEVPEAVLARFKQLWEWRDAELEHSGPSVELKESEGFGWWFISQKMDDAWSLDYLVRALRRHKKIEPDHLVMERLAELAPAHVTEVLEATRLMLEGDVNGWGIHLWEESVRTILGSAKDGNQASRETARQIVNFLGARGFLQFRDLA